MEASPVSVTRSSGASPSTPDAAQDVAQALDFGGTSAPATANVADVEAAAARRRDSSQTSSPQSVGAQASYDFSESSMEDIFISISGIIGAGKSTLATALGGVLGLPVYYEPVIDNIYLEDFYGDMKRYSFPLQVYLLNARFKQQQQIIWSGRGGVQDRTIYEDSVFARMLRNSGLMEERDFQTYQSLFNHMSNFMKKPNIIVHLDVSPEESLRRIKLRKRDCETSISIEYLRALHAAYEDFLHDISRIIPVIKVDYSEFRTAEAMAEKVKLEYSRIQNIRHVGWEDSPASTRSGSRPSSPITVDSLKLKLAALELAQEAGAAAAGN